MPYFHIDAEGYTLGDAADGNDITELESFPLNFQIDNDHYIRGGITFNADNVHFVNLIWHTKEWVYFDGIQRTRQSRLFKDIKENYKNFKIVSFDYLLVPRASK